MATDIKAWGGMSGSECNPRVDAVECRVAVGDEYVGPMGLLAYSEPKTFETAWGSALLHPRL